MENFYLIAVAVTGILLAVFLIYIDGARANNRAPFSVYIRKTIPQGGPVMYVDTSYDSAVDKNVTQDARLAEIRTLLSYNSQTQTGGFCASIANNV